MTNKPIWLIDVDGVINACCPPHSYPTLWPKETWRVAVCDRFNIQYSTEVVDFINKMSKRVDIQWHSTWNAAGMIESIVESLGFEDFGLSDSTAFRDQTIHGWWKMAYALSVAKQSPLIWTDDDLTVSETSYFWRILEKDVSHDDVLMIAPFTDVGLTKDHLDDIEAFVSKWEETNTA